MQIIIAGSREFRSYPTLVRVCHHYLQNIPNPVIVCGHARGTDQLALRYAKKYNLPINSFYPNWAKYGKAAGYIRNQQMARHGQALLVFWNGTSPGTKSMVQLAKKQQLPIRVFYFNQLFQTLGQPF